MKYITHEYKGSYKYIQKQTIFEISKTILLYAMAIGIFVIGYINLGTKKSLFSVIAVLALLPASKSLVGVIMFLRYRSITSELYSKIVTAAGQLPLLFELIFTTSDKSYYSKALVYSKGTICVLITDPKSDLKILERHLSNVLKTGGHGEINIKAYKNESDFIQRVKEMNEHLSDSSNLRTDAIFSTLKAVAL